MNLTTEELDLVDMHIKYGKDNDNSWAKRFAKKTSNHRAGSFISSRQSEKKV